MSAPDEKGREAFDWKAIADDAARFGRAGAGIVAERARWREAELLSAITAAVAAEREACAKLVDAETETWLRHAKVQASTGNIAANGMCLARAGTLDKTAVAIRARGDAVTP